MLYLHYVATPLVLLSLAKSEEFNCFVNHRNIRIDCAKPIERRRRQRQCSNCLERMQIQPCFSNEHFNDNIHRFLKEQETKEISLNQENIKHPTSDIIPFRTLQNPIITHKESLNLPDTKKQNDIEFFGPPFESTPPLASDHVPKILL
uniref:Uncharacterized protein n=1 Tax=Heterorhabditis bacteriophora TaxID=37862 RepID=A0A1I7XIN3_HETBA